MLRTSVGFQVGESSATLLDFKSNKKFYIRNSVSKFHKVLAGKFWNSLFLEF